MRLKMVYMTAFFELILNFYTVGPSNSEVDWAGMDTSEGIILEMCFVMRWFNYLFHCFYHLNQSWNKGSLINDLFMKSCY